MFEESKTARLLRRVACSAYHGGMVVGVNSVADEIRRRLPGIGQVKLHKLLYYAQGHHLATFGEPLFSETISAWDMGPVVGSLWWQEQNGEVSDSTGDSLGEAGLNTIGYTLSRYGGLTAQDLIRLSHNEPPWQRANETRPRGTSVRIPNEAIRDYFDAAAFEDDDTLPPLDWQMLKEVLADIEDRAAGPRQPDSLDELRARRALLA